MSIQENLLEIKSHLPENVTLVAVSKTKPVADILECYNAGQRVFGENKVQEMVEKWEQLPKDIEWHMIGHLQSNKVKYMAGFVRLIHGVDSLKLLEEIDKQARKHSRIIDCLLQIHIAQEETKFGLNEVELFEILESDSLKLMQNIRIVGLMGMASFTDNQEQIKNEFLSLKEIFDKLQKAKSKKQKANDKEQNENLNPTTQNLQPTTLSMGMSSDYKLAIDCGSTMVRVGSNIFGSR